MKLVINDKDFELYHRRLALESQFTNNALEGFSDFLPTIKEKLNGLVIQYQDTKDLDGFSKELYILTQKAKIKIELINFIDYSGMLVSKPEGLVVTLPILINELNAVLPKAYDLLQHNLNTFTIELSAFITNKEAKYSLNDKSHQFSKLTKERDALIDKLAPLYSESSRASKTYLSDAINRFSDLDGLSKDAIKLSKALSEQRIDQIKTSIIKANDLLNIIIANIKDNASISNEVAANISKGAFELAKASEFLAVVRFKSDAALASTKNLLTVLSELKI